MLKALRVGALIGTFSITAWLARQILRDEHELRLFLIRHTHRHCRKLLKALGVELTIEGMPQLTQGQYLVVANHVSYLDVLVIAAAVPSVFVTSVEVGQSRFLGSLARCAGSLFVERRNRAWLLREVSTITATLKEGFNVVIFPEGTTSAGTEVLPFKMSLLDAAVQSQVDVLPLCINYQISPDHRESVFYFGDMEFFPHLNRLMSLGAVPVGLKIHPPIPVTATSNRKALAHHAQQVIRESYRPIP